MPFQGKNILLIIAGVHGDEFEPMVAVRRLWNECYSIAIRGRLTLMPIVNEPAFHRGIAIYQSSFDDGGSALKLRAQPLSAAGKPSFNIFKPG